MSCKDAAIDSLVSVSCKDEAIDSLVGVFAKDSPICEAIDRLVGVSAKHEAIDSLAGVSAKEEAIDSLAGVSAKDSPICEAIDSIVSVSAKDSPICEAAVDSLVSVSAKDSRFSAAAIDSSLDAVSAVAKRLESTASCAHRNRRRWGALNGRNRRQVVHTGIDDDKLLTDDGEAYAYDKLLTDAYRSDAKLLIVTGEYDKCFADICRSITFARRRWRGVCVCGSVTDAVSMAPHVCSVPTTAKAAAA